MDPTFLRGEGAPCTAFCFHQEGFLQENTRFKPSKRTRFEEDEKKTVRFLYDCEPKNKQSHVLGPSDPKPLFPHTHTHTVVG